MTHVATPQETAVPLGVRTRLLHGYVQQLADSVGADVLHLKGPALDESLSRGARTSLDVDVLVRPAHVGRVLGGLRGLGWDQVSGFVAGSAFGHAVNLRHDLGLLDLHRSWPGFGIDPDRAFDVLWSQRHERSIAEIECAVPSLRHQRLLLLLHHGRSHGAREEDHAVAWESADEATRRQILADAAHFDAELALAASIGGLDGYRHERDYRLWKHFSEPEETRWREWWGRFGAARGAREKARVARMFFTLNRDIIRDDLGHDPSVKELALAAAARTRRAVSDLRLHRGGHS